MSIRKVLLTYIPSEVIAIRLIDQIHQQTPLCLWSLPEDVLQQLYPAQASYQCQVQLPSTTLAPLSSAMT